MGAQIFSSEGTEGSGPFSTSIPMPPVNPVVDSHEVRWSVPNKRLEAWTGPETGWVPVDDLRASGEPSAPAETRTLGTITYDANTDQHSMWVPGTGWVNVPELDQARYDRVRLMNELALTRAELFAYRTAHEIMSAMIPNRTSRFNIIGKVRRLGYIKALNEFRDALNKEGYTGEEPS